jgi:hypothetical protein
MSSKAVYIYVYMVRARQRAYINSINDIYKIDRIVGIVYVRTSSSSQRRANQQQLTTVLAI